MRIIRLGLLIFAAFASSGDALASPKFAVRGTEPLGDSLVRLIDPTVVYESGLRLSLQVDYSRFRNICETYGYHSLNESVKDSSETESVRSRYKIESDFSASLCSAGCSGDEHFRVRIYKNLVCGTAPSGSKSQLRSINDGDVKIDRRGDRAWIENPKALMQFPGGKIVYLFALNSLRYEPLDYLGKICQLYGYDRYVSPLYGWNVSYTDTHQGKKDLLEKTYRAYPGIRLETVTLVDRPELFHKFVGDVNLITRIYCEKNQAAPSR